MGAARHDLRRNRSRGSIGHRRIVLTSPQGLSYGLYGIVDSLGIQIKPTVRCLLEVSRCALLRSGCSRLVLCQSLEPLDFVSQNDSPGFEGLKMQYLEGATGPAIQDLNRIDRWASAEARQLKTSNDGIRPHQHRSRLSETRHRDQNGARPQHEWIATMKCY